MSELSKLLESRVEALVKRFAARVRDNLAPGGTSQVELEDHIPEVLRELPLALREGEANERSAMARAHGRQRHRVGFDIEAVVREYGVLRELIFDLVEESGLAMTLAEVRVLTDFLSNAVAEGVAEHARHSQASAQAAIVSTQAREAWLATTLGSIGDAVVACDAAGRVTFMNPVAEALTGWAHADARGLPLPTVVQLIDAKSRAGVINPVDHVRAAGGIVGFSRDTLLVRKDGSDVAIDDSAAPLGDSGGIVMVFRDVTERQNAARQAETRESEREALLARVASAHAEAEAERRKLHDIFEQAPVAVCILEGPTHVFALANPRYRALVDGADVVGRPLLEALPALAGQGFDTLLDRVMATGEPFIGNEIPAKLGHHKAGELVYMNFIYQPRRNARGAVDGVLVCAVEVTEQVLARQQMERHAAIEKERADFEKQLIGIVSHDLKNPLGAILLGVAALTHHDALDARSTRSLLRIQATAERAARMVSDLLDFTQARLGGGLPIAPNAVDAHALVRQAVDEVQANFPEREVDVRTSGNGTCTWDPDRIAQVISNLVTNALKYSPPGTLVRVAADAHDDVVDLRVVNGGAPISPEMLQRLFQPLQRGTAQLDTSGRSVGLGLYIVKHIVDAHGGNISVASTASEGTTFRVRLPRAVGGPR